MAQDKRKASKSKSTKRARSGPRITRVYTRTGDGGTTRLVGGQQIKKNSPRIEAFGTMDELGVWIGWAREALADLSLKLSSRHCSTG